jgi:DNA-directed RNA polymerase specialized sigma24 family protein
MTSFRKNGVRTQQANAFATVEDFYQVFDKSVNELYQLSFLLTADHRKAEECFMAGLEESVASSRVFKEWARSWAKRTIIQSAIRERKPRPPVASTSSCSIAHSGGELRKRDPHLKLDWIVSLADFDRFVFVMSVLEHYSDRDCAVLLGCSDQQVGKARLRGFEQLTDPHLMVA